MSKPMAFILLEAPATPNMRLLVDTMRQRHPELDWDMEPPAKGGDLPFLRCGRTLVVVMQVDAALPHDANLWQRATLTWPPAPQVAQHQRAHLIVSVMGEETNKLEAARLTTAVAGGLLATTPGACAVVWGKFTARSAQIWQDMSRNAFAPYPRYPFMLWLDIAPFRPGPSSIGAFTVGLYPFVGREIEFEVPGVSGGALLDRVAGLAALLIERGSVIADGDTIGESEVERIKVRHGTSRFDGSPVLVVGEAGPAHPSKSYPIISPAIARDHPLLAMLTRVGLYDSSAPDNQVQLQDIYNSEERLESYDQGVSGWLSNILASDAYVNADQKARGALAQSDSAAAKSALLPFAESVRKFQASARNAISQGKLYMFLPKQQPSKPS